VGAYTGAGRLPVKSIKENWTHEGNLLLGDIALWSARFEQPVEYEPGRHDELMGTQARRRVKGELLKIVGDDGEEKQQLRALVELGVRMVVNDRDRDDPRTDDADVLFLIEATFAVSYTIVGAAPPAQEMEHFLRFNCVHNAWPFWRQHVYDTLKRASLPVISIPLFSGAGSRKKETLAKKRRLRKE
jgi:Preprotein translocase subunit SecB